MVSTKYITDCCVLLSNYDIVWEELTYQNCSKVMITDDEGTVTTKEE